MKLYSELRERKEVPLRKVFRLNVLVHPGYINDTGNSFITPEQLEKAKKLPEEYEKFASKLPDDEILLIIIHQPPEKYLADIRVKKEYAELIKNIKESIKNRKQVIILTSETVPFSGADKDYDNQALENIRSLAKTRGYDINQETSVDIFGEMHDECVQEAFSGIRNADFFDSNKISISRDLTDRGSQKLPTAS